MTARHRRIPVLLLLLSSAVVVAFAGCAKQGEGEHCVSKTNGNNDCQSGLVCVSESDLQQAGTDLCCPPDGQPIHVASCTRRGASANTGGAGGSGGSGGTGGSDAGSAGSGGTAGSTSSGGAGGSSGSSAGGSGGVQDAGTG